MKAGCCNLWWKSDRVAGRIASPRILFCEKFVGVMSGEPQASIFSISFVSLFELCHAHTFRRVER